MSKKVQLEGNFGGSREDVYPATMAEIVYTQDGKNLEEKIKETNAQLFDLDFKQKLNNYVDYGKIELPDDFFNNIDFEICRGRDGVIKHDADINKYFNGATNIYLAGATGSDTSISGGRDEQTPLRSLTKVFELCESAVEDSFVINITTEVLPRNYSLPNVSETQLSKSYLIKHKEGKRVYMGSLELNLVYAPEDNVFKTNRSNVAAVFDKKKLCCDGSPRPYKKATTLNECKNTTGSWFNNGNELYINTLDGSTPNGDILVSLNVSAFVVRLTRNNKLALDNICLTYRNASVGSVVVRGNNTGHFIANNCVFTGSAYGNAYYTQSCQYTWLFNCVARDSLRDGFNYHNTVDGKNSFVFEYNCTAYDCGITDTNGNNNATTCHDGMNILRIGSKGRNTKGPVLADIQGCYSINYDCVMHDSTLGGGDTATAFFFSNDGVADKGKYYLFNCSGGGKNTKSIHTYDDAVVKVKNFKGNNIPKKEMIEFIE